ncbi:hypothetical protein Y026_938 [Burkholderia pseudomallei TSV28]|nr:hypothetical protein Y026_938 [Burkholderia pseudomallei TSV28]
MLIAFLMTFMLAMVGVFFFSRKRRDREYGAGVFGYGSGVLKVALLLTPIWGIIAAVISFKASREGEGWSTIYVILVVGLLLSGIHYLIYKKFKIYRVIVEIDGVRIIGMFRERFFLFSDVAKISLIKGGGGEYSLTIWGREKNKLAVFYETIDCFDKLVEMIRKRVSIPFQEFA